jgi:transcription antitermination factor NusG
VVLSKDSSKADKPKSKTKSKNSAKTAKVASVPPPPPIKWVIVQLTSLGEREKNIQSITRSAHRILGKPLDVFVPAVSQKSNSKDESQTMFYMDGYVFIRFEENVQYLKLADTMYFSTVLIQTNIINGERKKMFSLLDDKEIAPMRVGMQSLKLGAFKEGQSVKIIKGNFKGLKAKISYMHEDGENAQVHIELRSKPLLADFPVSYLKAADE